MTYSHIIRLTVLLLIINLLSACGGGGGGNSGNVTGGGTPNTANTPGLSLSANTINFTANHNGPTPPGQSIDISITDLTAVNLVAGFPPGMNQPGWLNLNFGGSNAAPSLIIAVNTTASPPAKYSTTVRIAILRSDQTVIAYRDVAVSYQIDPLPLNVAPAQLSFGYVVGAPAPVLQGLTIQGDVGAWTATANQDWVSLSSSAGTGTGSIDVGINPTGLAVGIHQSTITIASATETRTVMVSLDITLPAFVPNVASIGFAGIKGAPISSQALNIALSTGLVVDWTATSGASWLRLNKTSGNTPDSISVSIDSTALLPGNYATTITIGSSSLVTPLVVNVSLVLSAPNLAISSESLTFGGTDGRDLSDKTVQLSLNTGPNAYSWSITSTNDWLTVTPSSGSVSSNPVDIVFKLNNTGKTGGARNGNVVFTTQIDGISVSKTVAIQEIIDEHKVLANDVGVAMASMPSISKLTRTLNIRSNRGAIIDWTATADQSWLNVTASGKTPGNLILTANPAGLATDTMHYATVTISTPEPTIQHAEIIHLGLWVGAADPSTPFVIRSAFTQIISDPIRPLVYAHNGGTDISVYNIYTGGLITTIPAVAAQLGDLAIATDGTRLFAVDSTNFQVIPVDLPDYTIGQGWLIGSPYTSAIEYVRTNGTGILLTGAQYLNATSGLSYGNFYYGQLRVTVSLMGNEFCSINSGVSPYTANCNSLDFTTVNGGKFILGATTYGFAGSNGMDVALNADGTKLYAASGAPYEFTVFDTSVTATSMPIIQSLPGAAYPNNTEVARDGRIFVGAAVYYGPTDVWVYQDNGIALNNYYISGYAKALLAQQLQISGDGLRMITLTDDPSLKFTTVGP